jgi:hypothetical protein
MTIGMDGTIGHGYELFLGEENLSKRSVKPNIRIFVCKIVFLHG